MMRRYRVNSTRSRSVSSPPESKLARTVVVPWYTNHGTGTASRIRHANGLTPPFVFDSPVSPSVPPACDADRLGSRHGDEREEATAKAKAKATVTVATRPRRRPTTTAFQQQQQRQQQRRRRQQQSRRGSPGARLCGPSTTTRFRTMAAVLGGGGDAAPNGPSGFR